MDLLSPPLAGRPGLSAQLSDEDISDRDPGRGSAGVLDATNKAVVIMAMPPRLQPAVTYATSPAMSLPIPQLGELGVPW